MHTLSVEQIIHTFLALVGGLTSLAVVLAAALYGPKVFFKAMFPQLNLEKEVQQGNRAVALYCGLIIAATLIALTMIVTTVYTILLR